MKEYWKNLLDWDFEFQIEVGFFFINGKIENCFGGFRD
jgi:hypothetical protein